MNLIAVDHLAGHAGGGIENRRLGRHQNRFRHSAELQPEVGWNDIPDPNGDALSNDRLESLELRLDGVRAGVQVADLVDTFGIGDRSGGDVGVDVRRGDRDAWQNRSGSVFDCSADTAAKVLSAGGSVCEHEENRAQQTESKFHGNSSGKNSLGMRRSMLYDHFDPLVKIL